MEQMTTGREATSSSGCETQRVAQPDSLSDSLSDPLSAPVLQLDGAGGSAPPPGGPSRVGVARDGLRGSGAALPNFERIQSSFGRHDVSQVRVHQGEAVDGAASDLGARAYALGNDVGLSSGAQDLHTVAHEAAHTVQQAAGVHLAGQEGNAGDRWERNADAVADAVVAGESAEGLLDQATASGASGGAGLQLDPVEEPGLDAKLPKGTDIYKKDAVAATADKRKDHLLGKLAEKTRVMFYDIGDGTWSRVAFEAKDAKKTRDEERYTAKEAPLQGGGTVSEGWVLRDKLDNKHIATTSTSVSGHEKVTDPLWRVDERGKPQISVADVKQGNIGDCMLMAALVSIAAHQPDMIPSMLTDKGDTVEVALYNTMKAPVTVTVNKTVLRNTGTFSSTRIGARGPVLWPSILEKAVAKQVGGYRKIVPGQYEPYEVLLGHNVNRDAIFGQTGVDGLGKDEKLKQDFPALADKKYNKDWEKWKTFRGNGLADLEEHTGNFDPTPADVGVYLKKAGTSDAFRQAYVAALEGKKLWDGRVGTGDYSKRSLDAFARIQHALDRGEYVETGTKKTGKSGSGHSAGEDTTSVPGLAAPHAYAVMGTETHKNKAGKDVHYLRVRNPWGYQGMKYDKDFKRGKQDDAEFLVELSDLRRFFGENSKTSRVWRFTERSEAKFVEDAQGELDRTGELSARTKKALRTRVADAGPTIADLRERLQVVDARIVEARGKLDEAKRLAAEAKRTSDEASELALRTEREEADARGAETPDPGLVRDKAQAANTASKKSDAAYKSWSKLKTAAEKLENPVRSATADKNLLASRLKTAVEAKAAMEELLAGRDPRQPRVEQVAPQQQVADAPPRDPPVVSQPSATPSSDAQVSSQPPSIRSDAPVSSSSPSIRSDAPVSSSSPSIQSDAPVSSSSPSIRSDAPVSPTSSGPPETASSSQTPQVDARPSRTDKEEQTV